MSKPRADADTELEAIGLILLALEGLDGESIQRVLDYVTRRLSIPMPGQIKSLATISSVSAPPSSGSVAGRTHRPSIRDLEEEKQPESSNQMAALVAYYLS